MSKRFKMKTKRRIKRLVAATMAAILLTPSDLANLRGVDLAQVRATTISDAEVLPSNENASDSYASEVVASEDITSENVSQITPASETDITNLDEVSVSSNDAIENQNPAQIPTDPSEVDDANADQSVRRRASASADSLETVWNGYVVNEEYASWEAGEVLMNVNSFRYMKTYDGLTVTGYGTLTNGRHVPVILSLGKKGASYSLSEKEYPYQSSVEYLGNTWYLGETGILHMTGGVTSTEGKAYKLSENYETPEDAALALLEQMIIPVELAVPAEDLTLKVSNTEHGEIELSWSLEADAVTYEIYRDQVRIESLSAEEIEQRVAESAEGENSDGATQGTDGQQLFHYQDILAVPGNTYGYKVFALDEEGNTINTSVEMTGTVAPELILTDNLTLDQDMTVYSVEIRGGSLDLNGHALTVLNNYVQGAGQLSINKGSLYVGQDMTMSRAYLNMTDSADTVFVNGTFSYQGYQGKITDGVLECKGDFLVENGGYFIATDYHKVILSGEDAQKISLTNTSCLAGLSIKNYSEEGVLAEEGFPIASLELEEEAKFAIADLTGEAGEKLNEDLTVEGDYYLIGGQLDLNGYSLHVTGSFYQLSGEILFNEGSLTVDGDFVGAVPVYDEEGVRNYRRSGGYLTMLFDQDVLSVYGDLILVSCVDSTGKLSKGRIELGKNLIVDTTYQNKVYAPSADHLLVFMGEEGQEIWFDRSTLNSSYIQNVRFANHSEEGITFENRVKDVDVYPLIVGQISFGNADNTEDLDNTKDQTLSTSEENVNDTTEGQNRTGINGIPAFCATTICDTTFPGDVANTENCVYQKELSIAGDLHVFNVMTVEGPVSVGGNLTVHSGGSYYYPAYLNIYKDGYLKVAGNVEVQVNAILNGNSGTLEIGKDLTVAQRMQFTNTHKTIFSGKEKQTISVPEGCYFAIVELCNTSDGGVYSETVFKRNELIRNGCALHYGALQGEFGWTLEKDEVYEGDLVLLDDVLDLNGHTLTVTGDLVHSSGEIKLSKGSLIVKGDYRSQSPDGDGKYGKGSGVLTMINDEDKLIVEGDLIIDAFSDSTNHLTAGSICLYGDFAVYGDNTCKSFAPAGSHKVILCGDKAQTVTISKEARKCMIANLEVTNLSAEGVIFENPYIAGMVTLPETDPVIKGTIAISGSTEFSKTYPGNVSVFDRTDLLKDLHIGGDLYCNYRVRIGHATIKVDGDLILDNTNRYSNEEMTFQYADSVLDVDGDVVLRGYTYMTGAKGCLKVGGDLIGGSDIRFTKEHKTVFDGNDLQTIDTTPNSYFAIVELLNNSKEGVYSKSVFKRDQLIRHNTHLRYEGLEGEFGWMLEEDEVYEGDLILLDDVLDLNGHTLTVTGNLTQNAGEVRLNGGTLKILKGYQCNGLLTMTNEADTVMVNEDLIITTPTDTTGYLSAGKLYVKGNVSIDNLKNATTVANKSFMASGDHTLILNGDKRQEIYIASPGSKNSVIANLTIENESEDGVVFDNSKDTYPLINGTIDTKENCVITGTISIGSGTSFTKPYPGNVFINEAMELTKDATILGNVTCKTNLNVSAAMVVGGDFRVYSDNYYVTNRVELKKNDAKLEVAGIMYVDDGAMVYGNYGSLVVGKDLIVTGNISFRGEHKTILNGQGRQTVQIPDNNSCFAVIELQNRPEEGVSFNRKPVCEKLLRNGCVISFPNDAWTYGYTLEEDETHESMILFDDTLDLNDHTLTIEGDLIQAGGEIKLNHGTLKVLGDYRIQTPDQMPAQSTDMSGQTAQNGSATITSYSQSQGTLVMDNEEDKVIISGDFVIQAKDSVKDTLTNGTLEVKGNITTLGNRSFTASEDHTLLLTGDKTQNISSTRELSLANVINRNTVKVTCDTNIRLSGNFTDEGNNMTSNAYLIVTNADQISDGRYSSNLMLTGNSKLAEDLSVQGRLDVEGELDVNGHKLTAGEIHATDSIKMSGGILTCVEDLTLDGKGMLCMTEGNDYVLIGGDLYFNTFADHEGFLTNGTLELRGDFKQDKAANFKATDEHTTILSRKRTAAGKDRIATIRFDHFEEGMGFATLILKKAKDQYRFTPDCERCAAKVVIDPDDTQAPTELEYLVADIVTENSVRLSFGGATDNVAIRGYAIYRDGKLIANTSANTYTDKKVLPSTEYVYRVYPFDNDQNMAEGSPECRATTKADTTPPTKPANLSVKTRTGSSITLTWNNSKDNVKVAGYNVYQEETLIAELVTETEKKVTNLDKNTAYHFHVEAVDENGNVSEAGEVLETSTVMPKITDITPQENEAIGGNTITIQVMFKDAGNSTGNTVNIQQKKENGTWETLNTAPLGQMKHSKGGFYTSYDWDISALLEEKEYRLKILLTDEDGNTDSKEISYYIDREAPKVPTNVKADGSDGNVFVTWEPSVSADTASYKVYRKSDEKEAYELIDEIEGRYENGIVDKKVEIGTSYYYAVSAQDTFGNESEKAQSTMITVGEDEKAPTVKGITPGAGRINGIAQIEVTATDNKKVSKVGIQYRAEDAKDWTDVEEKELTNEERILSNEAGNTVIEFSWDTTKLADGVYYINTYAIDEAGNRSEEEYTRRYEVDNTGIGKIVISKTDAGASFVRLDWEDVTEKDFDHFAVEQLINREFTEVATVKDKLGSYVRGLKPGVEYTFRVVGYDDLGNRGVASEEVKVTTIEDTVAPYITKVSPEIASYNHTMLLGVDAGDDVAVEKAVFSYATDGENFTKLSEVKADVSNIQTNSSSAKEQDPTSVHLEYLLDLKDIPEGELTIRVEVYDRAGNKNVLTKEGKEVESVYTIDKTAPSKVSSLKVAQNEGYVELRWTDVTETETDIRTFKIYRADQENGIYTVICDACTTKNYYDTDVDPGNTFLYKVSAVDEAGNEGACSDELLVNVAEDDVAPQITGMSPKKGEVIGRKTTIKVLAVDKGRLSNVKLYYQGNDETDIWHEVGMQETEETSSLVTIEWDTTGLKEGTYSICAIATDLAGNESEPYFTEYELDATAPVITSFKAENGHFENILYMEVEGEDFDYFEIQRREAGCEFKTIGYATENVYHDTKLEVGTLYYYRLAAYDVCGNADYSKEETACADDQDFEAPMALLTENVTGYVNMEIALDGKGSTDNTGIAEYIWDMGDGTTYTGSQIRHIYEVAGDYTIKLCVIDNAGNENTTTSTAHIYDKTGTGVVHLQVQDEAECGIEYALIYLKLPDESVMSLRTNDQGYVDIVAPIGGYSIAAFENGYLPNDIDVIFNEYEEKEYVIQLEKKELIAGSLTVRRMTLEEMEEAGVDFSDPDNYHYFTFTVVLPFEAAIHKIEDIRENGVDCIKPGVAYGVRGSISPGNYSGKGRKKNEQDRITNPPPQYIYIYVTQSISWLKEIYEVELCVVNMADYQYSLENSVATLNLPYGVSLVKTFDEQSLTQEMGTIGGQQYKTVDWIIKGDLAGSYSLSADFEGTLMPFEERVSAHFETENEFEVTAGEGIIIYVMPESELYEDEDYFVEFAVVNATDHPIYNFKTTIGHYEAPTPLYTCKLVNTGEETVVTDSELYIEDPSDVDHAVVISNGQKLNFMVLNPGQFFYGTYKTRLFDNEDDIPLPKTEEEERKYYRLVADLIEVIEEQNIGVEVIVKPIPSHIQKEFVRYIRQTDLFGDPIDVKSGYFTDNMTALSVNGMAVLPFDISYESGNVEFRGDMGYGWRHDYETKLTEYNGIVRVNFSPSASALYMREDFNSVDFYGKEEDGKIIIQSSASNTVETYKCMSGYDLPSKLLKELDGSYTLEMETGVVYRFDAQGRLIKVTDEESRSIELSYTDNITKITDVVSGKNLYYSKNEAGLVTSVYDDYDRSTQIIYDDNENMVEIILPNDDVWTYTYDENHRIISESNEQGCFVENQYNEENRVVYQKDGLGNITTCEYEQDDQYLYVTIHTPEGATQYAVVRTDGNLEKVVDGNGNSFTYSYDSEGRLVCERDGNGSTVYREYDSNGNLIKLTDQGGVSSYMSYDNKGNLSRMRNERGRIVTYSYDDKKRMVSSRDANGLTTSNKYDDNGQLIEQSITGLGSVKYGYTDGLMTSVTDYKGNVTRTEYDKYGNAVRIIDPLGNVTQTEYDIFGRTIAQIDPLGNRTQYTYDCNGNCLSETDSLGHTIRHTYDISGNLLSTELPDGTTYTYEYDLAGNCIKESYPDGTYSTAEYDMNGNKIKEVLADGTSFTYTYDGADYRLSETDGNGDTIFYEYYPNGNIYKITYPDGEYEIYTYNTDWKVVTVTDKNGYVTSYEYDSMGRQILMRDPLGNEYKTEYDILNRITKETDPNGNSTTYEYDANSNCVKKTDASGTSVYMAYDANNQMIEASVKDKNGVDHTISYKYDKLGRVVSQTDEEGYTSYVEYDSVGNVKSTIDANGNASMNASYDSLGRLNKVQDALGLTTTYQYDKLGNLLKEVTKLSEGTEEKTYSYDKLGRLKKVTENGTITTMADYDVSGNVIQMVDANGGITEYEYDNMGRVTKEISPLGNATSYVYNAQGLLANIKNANNQNTSYTYDKLGRIVTMTDGTGITSYTYDANGNVLTVEDKNGAISRKYDEMNRVKEYTDYRGNTIKYKYDELGNLIELTYPGGEIVRYSYYKNGWLHTVTDPEGKKTSYTYDGCGRQLTCLRPNNTLEICNYNAAGQLVEQKDVKIHRISEDLEIENKIKIATTEGEIYFAEDEVLTSFVYTYDEKGNIASVTGTETVNTKEGISALKSASFEYDAENRLIRYNGEELKYDAEGNMIYGPVNGQMTELTYDCRNRLVSAGDLRYTYDTENNRIAMENSDTKEEYLIDTVSSSLSQLLVSTSYKKNASGTYAKSEKKVYIYGNGLISEATGDIVLYHHYNNLGSTIKLTDFKGNVVAAYTYGTYGELLSGNVTMTRFLYNGRYGVATDDNGLYYMRQRYYNPEIKRFVNRDVVIGSITNSQSLNRYCYVQGNPVSFIDPFGLSPLAQLWADKDFRHGVLGVLGCIPFVGFFANCLDAYYYFKEDDPFNGWLSVLGAISMGSSDIACGIAKLAHNGSKVEKWARCIGASADLIANGASFLKGGKELWDNSWKMIDKYVVKGQKFDLSDEETGREVATIGLNILTMVFSGMGAHGAAKTLSKESKLFNKFATRIAERANKIKCGIRNAKDQIAGFASGIKNKVGEWVQLKKATNDVSNLEFKTWLNKGISDNKVYFGIDTGGNAVYTGITKQSVKARLYQHNRKGKNFAELRVIYSNLTKNQARAIEQYFIEKGPNAMNKIASISKISKYYKKARKWAVNYIKEH